MDTHNGETAPDPSRFYGSGEPIPAWYLDCQGQTGPASYDTGRRYVIRTAAGLEVCHPWSDFVGEDGREGITFHGTFEGDLSTLRAVAFKPGSWKHVHAVKFAVKP